MYIWPWELLIEIMFDWLVKIIAKQTVKLLINAYRYLKLFFGAIKVLRNVVGVSDFPQKNRYEGVRFNVIGVTTYKGVCVKFPGK